MVALRLRASRRFTLLLYFALKHFKLTLSRGGDGSAIAPFFYGSLSQYAAIKK
jgi:hypothetical protein